MKKKKKVVAKKKTSTVKKKKSKPNVAPIEKPRTAAPIKLTIDIQEFKDQLDLMQIDLSETIRKKKEEVIPEPEVGDEADIAVRSVERDLSFETGGNELHLLEEVEAALRRIEKGIFGLCEACGTPIAEARLRAMPYARYCVKCQARFEHL